MGPRTPRKWGSPTLYCYSAIRLLTYEVDIVRMQAKTDGSIGIFGCDEYDVFTAQGRGWIGDGPNGPVWTHPLDSVDNTSGVTDFFQKVWLAVQKVGKWAFTEWTIKMDPDAVLFAARLRLRLAPHTGKPVFIQNCANITGGTMMFGSLEAISHQGMDRYFSLGMYQCSKGFQYEDRGLGECLNQIGIEPVTDTEILGDKMCFPGVFSCAGPDDRAAYHFYKDVHSWMRCYYQGKAVDLKKAAYHF